MKTYNYHIPAPCMWASWDYGTVEAESREDAQEKAIKELDYAFEKINHVLASADVTQGFHVEYDKDTIEIEEEKNA